MKLIGILSLSLLVAACGDDKLSGTVFNVPTSGLDGPIGRNGHNSLVQTNRTNDLDASICLNSNGVVIQSGIDNNDDGTLEITEVNNISIVCDGVAGPQGPSGANTPFQVVSIIDVCGDAIDIQDEVFLRLANGSILVLFTDSLAGDNPRLSLLTPGNYMTSDGSSCHFSIDSNLIVTDEDGNSFSPVFDL